MTKHVPQQTRQSGFGTVLFNPARPDHTTPNRASIVPANFLKNLTEKQQNREIAFAS